MDTTKNTVVTLSGKRKLPGIRSWPKKKPGSMVFPRYFAGGTR